MGAWGWIFLILLWVLPVILSTLTGKDMGKTGTGFLLGFFLGWIGFIIVSVMYNTMRREEEERERLKCQKGQEHKEMLEAKREQERKKMNEGEEIVRYSDEDYLELQRRYELMKMESPDCIMIPLPGYNEWLREQEQERKNSMARQRELEDQERRNSMARQRELEAQQHKEIMAALSGGREVVKVKCSKCGALMNEGVKFCSECGAPM